MANEYSLDLNEFADEDGDVPANDLNADQSLNQPSTSGMVCLLGFKQDI